jgi:hypothetical protein
MSIHDYPETIFVLHKVVCNTNHILYNRYAIDDYMVYYKLTHDEELYYKDENVEDEYYMLSKPLEVYRYLALNKKIYDILDHTTEFELGDFLKENMGDECLFSKNQNL